MRVLIYPHDTYGLGNIRRMLSIAKDLNDKLEVVTLPMVSGPPMLQSSHLSNRIDYVKLPSISRFVSDAQGKQEAWKSKPLITSL